MHLHRHRHLHIHTTRHYTHYHLSFVTLLHWSSLRLCAKQERLRSCKIPRRIRTQTGGVGASGSQEEGEVGHAHTSILRIIPRRRCWIWVHFTARLPVESFFFLFHCVCYSLCTPPSLCHFLSAFSCESPFILRIVNSSSPPSRDGTGGRAMHGDATYIFRGKRRELDIWRVGERDGIRALGGVLVGL